MAVMAELLYRAFGDQHVTKIFKLLTIVKKNNRITHSRSKLRSLWDHSLQAHMGDSGSKAAEEQCRGSSTPKMYRER
jgi:hypothetical protein